MLHEKGVKLLVLTYTKKLSAERERFSAAVAYLSHTTFSIANLQDKCLAVIKRVKRFVLTQICIHSFQPISN